MLQTSEIRDEMLMTGLHTEAVSSLGGSELRANSRRNIDLKNNPKNITSAGHNPLLNYDISCLVLCFLHF